MKKTIALVPLLLFATPALATPALATPPPDVVGAVAQADTNPATLSAPPPAMAQPIVLIRPARPKLKDRLMTYASFGFNAYTYLGATAKAPSTQLTPATRGIIYQQVGAAYYFHRLLRLQLTFIFGETVSNQPANTSTLSTFAIVPWLVFSTHGFFTGAGPQLAPVSYGKSPNFDAGIYTATGYAAKLGHGLSLPMSVQLVVMLNQRTSVAITPAVALAYRF